MIHDLHKLDSLLVDFDISVKFPGPVEKVYYNTDSSSIYS